MGNQVSQPIGADKKQIATEKSHEMVIHEVANLPAADCDEPPQLSRSAPPKRSLSRSMSMKDAHDHVMDHKHKYSSCCIASTVAIILGCVLGLAAMAYYASKGELPLSAQLAASKGTSVPPVSPLPSKGSSSRRRLFQLDKAINNLRVSLEEMRQGISFERLGALRGKKIRIESRPSSVVTSPADLPELSDYNKMLDPTYIVSDESASPVNQINMISCYVNQLKAKDMLSYRSPYVALVDTSLCDSESEDVQMWTVDAHGPETGGGDGEYLINAMFRMSFGDGSPPVLAHVMIDNRVDNGELLKSTVSWNIATGVVTGTLSIDYPSNATNSSSSDYTVEYIQMNVFMGADPEFLSARYNPTTFVGDAMTQSLNDGSTTTTYTLSFTEDAILRKATSNGQDSTVCLDFDVDSRFLTGSGYTLFNAYDGSQVLFENGFVIQRAIEGFTQPAQAWINNWGVYAFWTYDDDSGEWLDGSEHFADQASVQRVNYDGRTTNYKLNLVNARLTKTVNHHIQLDELKGLPLVVRDQMTGLDTTIVTWNGTYLLRTSTFVSRCVYYYNWGTATPLEIADGVIISNYQDCYCLNTDGTLRTSGATTNYYDTNSESYSSDWSNDVWSIGLQSIEVLDTSPEVFTPSSGQTSLNVHSRAGNLQGTIEFTVEKLQICYGLDTREYVEGQKVKQVSSGAEGVVYKSTTIRLTGLICRDCLEITYRGQKYDWGQCSAPSNSNPQSVSYIMKGAKLTQGTAVGYAIEDWAWIEWNGLSIEVESGTFDLLQDIEVTYGNLAHSWIEDITGTISMPTTNSLSWNWNDIIIEDAGDCGDNTFVMFDATLTGSNGAIMVYRFGENVWAYVSDAGTSCNNPTVNLTEISGFFGPSCTKVPQIKIKCTAGIRSDSSTAVIKRTSSVRFQPYWTQGSTSLLLGEVVGEEPTTAIGLPWWCNEDFGEILPPTGETTLTYTTHSIVNAGENVPNLLCYDNCPNPDPETWPSCSGSTCKQDRVPTHLSNQVDIVYGGECNSSLSTVDFTNIDGNPTVTIEWEQLENTDGSSKYYVSFVQITDPGYGCDANGGTTPTLTFLDPDKVCEELPEVTVSCYSGNDANDYRQAFHYTFNDITGAIMYNGSAAVINSNDNYESSWSTEWFGPFFEDTDDTKSRLLCDYDPSIVCPWKAYSSIDVMYTYQSGPGATRASLLKADQSAVVFSEPLALLYQHEGHDSNSGTDFDGVSTVLSYYSVGDLQGLPQFCMDPATQAKSDVCIPSGSADATVNIDDIIIPSDLVIYDLNKNAYYAKARTMQETYPVASDSSICNGLNFALAPDPVSINSIVTPDNVDMEYPSLEELETNYLGQGNPAVIRGVVNPIYG